ncbi:AFG1/ZapE family ATPase, partial [Francisella tularensis subsp. holarctica]|uniref:AFG1/ZapE family ATPase n=1 Tax=Francisella tularensis TaxID=263 RepID=UPI002381A6EC
RKYQGEQNPISKVAFDMAKQTQIICFDEFVVEDIADAMILGSIFTELFKFGGVLVATSNLEPEKLYQNGLQRELCVRALD